jgi:hypothetical protein
VCMIIHSPKAIVWSVEAIAAYQLWLSPHTHNEISSVASHDIPRSAEYVSGTRQSYSVVPLLKRSRWLDLEEHTPAIAVHISKNAGV